MAPNIPLRDTWAAGESDEASQETHAHIMPELFLSHLPQHLQNPDSPNLHLHQHQRATTQKTHVRNQSARSTLKVLRSPPSGEGSGTRQEEEVIPPSRVSALEDVMHATGEHGDHNIKNSRVRGPGAEGEGKAILETVPQAAPSEPSPRASKDITFITRSPDGLAPESLIQVTREPEVDPTVVVASGRPQDPTRRKPTTHKSSTWPSTTSTHHHHDPGVLKLPGHEPEAPADLVLIHHDRAIDTHNQTGLNGIFVRDDSTSLTAEGATALILAGICTVFLVFICFIFFIQKVRRQRLDRKVQQSGEVIKPQTTYEGPGYMSPNPLTLLPPALIQALALATQGNNDNETAPPCLTMEPPLASNSLGRLWFSVFYDFLTSDLVLKVLHARYPKGRGWSSNPGEVWVQSVVLSPLNTVIATANTGTRRASSAPVFKQNFRFKVDDEEVTQYLLRLTLYDRHPDQPGEKASGAVIVPLSTLDLCSQETLARDLQ